MRGNRVQSVSRSLVPKWKILSYQITIIIREMFLFASRLISFYLRKSLKVTIEMHGFENTNGGSNEGAPSVRTPHEQNFLNFIYVFGENLENLYVGALSYEESWICP